MKSYSLLWSHSPRDRDLDSLSGRRLVTRGGRSHRHSNTWTRSQHRNGIADSLPSGSGNLDTHLGLQRLPLADALQPLEPVQGPIDLTAQVHPMSLLFWSTLLRRIAVNLPTIL